MNQVTIRNQLIEWMQSFVEKPHPALGNWPPCPYARQARLTNKMEIVFAERDFLLTTIKSNLHKLVEKDVIVICFDHTLVSYESLGTLVNSYNKDYLMPLNYVVLEDHPDAPETLNGVDMNFGYCGLLLLSKLDVLNDASVQLKSKGYYNHWPKNNLDYVVNWRFE